MRRPDRLGLSVLIGLAVIGAIVFAYRAGYRDGLENRGPRYRVLSVVRGTGNPKSSGTRYQYFDVRKPEEAAKLRDAERRLEEAGASYFVDDAHVETSISPKPNLLHPNAWR